MLKKTPFYHIHEKLGAKLADFAGFEMPIQYKGIKIEHNAVRNTVGVFDVSHMGEFMITGKEALQLLQKVTVNDASKLIPGKAQYTCFCNQEGGIIDDFIVYMLKENEYMLVVNSANIQKDYDWIVKNNTFDAKVEDVSDEYGLLAVQGPKSVETVQKLTDVDLNSIGFYSFEVGKIAGTEMIISATGYTGEKGFELYFKTKGVDIDNLWNKIIEAGEEFDIEPCGLGSRDTLRLEMGFGLYGNDISENTHPFEARLGWITKLDKESDFIGKEKLSQIKEKGNQRQLIGFLMDMERAIPRQGYQIFNENDEPIGEVTSGTMSITLGKGLGMGYVKKEYATEGSTIYIPIRKKMGKAIITRPPFIKK